MFETVQFLEKRLSPDLATAAGLVVIIYFAILGLVKLFEIWRSFKTRSAVLQEEKLFHEIAKLRYEIEAIRKQHQLPDLYASVNDRVQQTSINGHTAVQKDEVSSFAGSHFRQSLSEISEFSLAPLISVLRLRLKKPPVGVRRMFWSLKWLAALLIGTAAGFGTLMEIGAGSGSDNPQVLLLLIAFLIGAYLLTSCFYNASIAIIAAIKSQANR